jgi:hypothetical protein
VFDHDFPSFALGKIIPHGLYDVKRNVGHITLGTSHDTSEFACASFRRWWQRHGRYAWPRADSILLLCDGGGSNNCRHHLFKQDLQKLVNAIGVEIRVAHYPPHCSKYNPIERRLSRTSRGPAPGLIFRTLDIVTAGLRRVATSTGLKVTHAVHDRIYPLKRVADAAFLAASCLQYDELLPEWNYVIAPQF